MSNQHDSVIWGAILLVIGAGFLLWNLDILGGTEAPATWALVALFALLGLGFIFGYLNQRAAWWRLIPGIHPAGGGHDHLPTCPRPALWLGRSSAAGQHHSGLSGDLPGDRTEQWWALIPAGSVAVMVAVVLLSTQPAVEPRCWARCCSVAWRWSSI